MEPSNFQSNKDTQNQPANGKGKEPASLASRIVSSASGLAKDVVGSSSSSDFASSLATASGLGSKAPNGISTSQTHWTETLPARPGTSSSNGFLSNKRETFPSESFRTESIRDARNGEFQDFMDGPHSSLANGLTKDSQDPSLWPGEFHHQSSLNGGINDHIQDFITTTSNHPAQSLHYDDGTEVSMLLSDPQFMAGADPMDITMTEPAEETVVDLFRTQYSPGEERAAKRIKSSLPSPPVHRTISPDNPLNLMPELTELHQDIRDHLHEYASSASSDEDSAYYLANTPQREHWVAEWEGVLNSYTDDVWGDMLGAVKEARSQLEEVKAGSKRVDNKAVNRLKLILGHVVQNGNSDMAYLPAISLSQNSVEGINLKSDDTQRYQEAALTGVQQLNQNRFMMVKDTMRQAFEQSSHQEMQSRKRKQNERQLQHFRRDSPMVDQGQDEELSTPTFHCPWISCHQRFHNARELRLHTSAHTQYACPHEDCTAQFKSHEEWAEHIEGPHHDLLETSFRSLRDLEG